jgi:hypothetical protein
MIHLLLEIEGTFLSGNGSQSQHDNNGEDGDP